MIDFAVAEANAQRPLSISLLPYPSVSVIDSMTVLMGNSRQTWLVNADTPTMRMQLSTVSHLIVNKR